MLIYQRVLWVKEGEYKMKCKYCGYDSDYESIKMVGAPCGFNGCMIFTCCQESWKTHMKDYHKDQIDRETGKVWKE